MPCQYCEYAVEHFWWGPDMPKHGTHCKGCHRTWTGSTEIHCVMCHRHFSCVAALEKHKVGVTCLDPDRVALVNDRKALVTRQSRFGVTWMRHTERDPSPLWNIREPRLRPDREPIHFNNQPGKQEP